MARWRLGVALLFDAETTAELNGLRRALDDGARLRIPPHLTLVPPVNVREGDIPAALGVLRAAAGRHEPFTVTLGAPSTFRPVSPTLKIDVVHPSVQSLRDAVFTPPLERSLTFAFLPHVTLADELDEYRTAAATAALAGYEREVEIEAITLLREEEHRKWTPIADVRLGRPTVAGRGGLEVNVRSVTVIDPYTRGALGIDEDYDEAFIAFQQDDAVGVVTRSGTSIRALAVLPAHRGLGTGTVLARHGLDQWRINQVPMHLSEFFTRFGFSIDGLRRLPGE